VTQLLFVGLVEGRWVVAKGRRDASAELLPLPCGRPAGEALDVAHSLFPDALLAVTKLPAAWTDERIAIPTDDRRTFRRR
jgi:hypothetical protein